MQQLRIYQSLWAMEQRRPGVAEDVPEVWLDRIVEAGFDGVCVDPSVAEIDQTLALAPLIEARGLGVMVNAFPATLDEMRPLLEMSLAMGAVMVNAIGAVMPLTVAGGEQVVRHWLADAEAVGIPLLFETHRDCTLNDLYFALQLMERVPEMRLCADLSHYVIDREMRLPLVERDAAFMSQVLARSDCFQGRVASREQIQVQIDFPQHRAWVAQFRAWWEEGMRGWRARNHDDAELVFLCELGPPPYAITDRDQQELSDRWQEALTLRHWAQEHWERSALPDGQ